MIETHYRRHITIDRKTCGYKTFVFTTVLPVLLFLLNYSKTSNFWFFKLYTFEAFPGYLHPAGVFCVTNTWFTACSFSQLESQCT